MKLSKRTTDISLPGFTLKATGVSVEGAPDVEEWRMAMQFVQRAGGAVMWWLGDLLVHGEASYGELEEVGDGRYEYSTLRDAKYVSANVPLSVRTDTLSFTHHHLVAPLPKQEQKKWLKKAEKAGWSVAELRKALRAARNGKPGGIDAEPGTYKTIYADPPWKYGNQATRAATDNHYETLDVDDICALEIDGVHVSELAASNSHLHLWTTNAFIFEAKRVIEAWGFEYKSCFVWVKPQIGIGNYWRVSHEFMLFGIRGKLKYANRSQSSWLESPRTRHSTKPGRVREIVELVSPAPRLELFAREKHPGWTSWGNEAPCN